MAGINKVILIGRIGKDPEIYTFDDGTKKISFSLATTENYRDKTGEWVDQTEWHNIIGFRYLAEKNLAKGDLIYVEGKIKTRKYTDRDGNEKYITEIIAEKINILTRYQPGNQTYSGNTTEKSDTAQPQQNIQPDQTAGESPDDLPF